MNKEQYEKLRLHLAQSQISPLRGYGIRVAFAYKYSTPTALTKKTMGCFVTTKSRRDGMFKESCSKGQNPVVKCKRVLLREINLHPYKKRQIFC